MSDFCKQCSEKLMGKDYGDLRGLSKPEDTANGLFAPVICEGCGFVYVDHTGKCVGGDCMENHTPKVVL